MAASVTPSVRDLLCQACARIERFDAECLLAHALAHDRAWLFAHATDVPDAPAAACFDALVARREAGEPVAYLAGHCGFWTLELAVTPATLIPRPESELLVEQALARLPRAAPCTVADLGTGSGAIALAIASERPAAQITAVDASGAALDVAADNAGRHGLQRVEWLCGDWLAPLAGRCFDLIVANPPYVAADDPHLRQGDVRFEPRTALVAGVDGLDAIRNIVRDARDHLVPGGWLLLEHGWQQGEAVRALLRDAGHADVFTARDLENRDRVSGGRRPAAAS